MQKILVSACLLGEPVRYNGAHKRSDDAILQRWVAEGRAVMVCPEVVGGLPVPRPPAEIEGGAGGAKVLAGEARVVDDQGNDVSPYFVRGAEVALETARRHGIRIAVLKERSPSCGSSFSYDGTFTGTPVSLPGVTTALLRSAGIEVFGEDELAEAEAALRRIEADTQ